MRALSTGVDVKNISEKLKVLSVALNERGLDSYASEVEELYNEVDLKSEGFVRQGNLISTPRKEASINNWDGERKIEKDALTPLVDALFLELYTIIDRSSWNFFDGDDETVLLMMKNNNSLKESTSFEEFEENIRELFSRNQHEGDDEDHKVLMDYIFDGGEVPEKNFSFFSDSAWPEARMALLEIRDLFWSADLVEEMVTSGEETPGEEIEHDDIDYSIINDDEIDFDEITH